MTWTRHKYIRLNLLFFLIFSGLVICDVNWFHCLVIFVKLRQAEIWADVYAIPLHIFSLHINGSCIKNYSYRIFRHLPWQFSLHICHSCIPYHCCAYFGHFIELENLVRKALVLEGKGFSNSWFCLNFFAFPCHRRRWSKRGRFKVRFWNIYSRVRNRRTPPWINVALGKIDIKNKRSPLKCANLCSKIQVF